ncbi:alpha/beta fold hydrolase [Falsiphaeobacter marinintestinus]|uniref:alpha/beta fold hydrolase n=1 Tax=Falsiphaeobacter marinintestinus TaxID=1492905 RepID=UPI0011B5F573|nr:alpha/beta fold hydrolase [Phaeobacter marinintestinus]
MRIKVNGVRLFVDFEGAGLVPDGSEMREKPTLIVLHGGPGADHSIYKPGYGAHLSDLCQILYLDHRGNGRSDDGDPALWTLAQWADDIAALCDQLDIVRPIIFGASFGGFVAQAFATRYPERLGGLILSNTAAKVDFETMYAAFERIGGAEAGKAARTYWGAPTSQSRAAYAQICLPHYGVTEPDPAFWARIIKKDPVALHFNGPANEMGRFDFRNDLARVTSPAMVVSGDRDPVMPDAFAAVIVDSLANATPLTYHCLESAGHVPQFDTPDLYFQLLRDFVKRIADHV